MQLIFVTSWMMAIGFVLLSLISKHMKAPQGGARAIAQVMPNAIIGGVAIWFITFVVMLPVAAVVLNPMKMPLP